LITEVITYIRTQIETTAIDTAYQDLIPSVEETNVAAVRSLPGAGTTNVIAGDNYSTQLFSVLYRGNTDRLTSLNNIDSVFDTLNNVAEIELTNTRISIIEGQRPAYAFEDENGNIHYNMNLTVTYNKK